MSWPFGLASRATSKIRESTAATRTASASPQASLIRHTLLLLLLATVAGEASPSSLDRPPSLYEQRMAYKNAIAQLRAGRTTAFRQLKAELATYPLHGYLEYHQLRHQLSQVTAMQINQFREHQSNLPVADIVYRRWLKRLGERRAWSDFLEHFEPTDDVELQCYRLRALYGVGRREEAFAGVGELWTVARSQPKACDPLFDVWIDAGNLTESAVWQRLQLALRKNQRQLARYLLRFFTEPRKTWAQALYNVHVNPALITRTDRYTTDNELSRAVIAHGLRRLAPRDADAAREAWHDYHTSHAFRDDEVASLEAAISLGEAKAGEFPDPRPQVLDDHTTEAIALAAVQRENWSEAYYWIERLPGSILHTNRWQYWLARALASTHLGSERAQLTYRALARQRDYYGFLAAERLGTEPQLNQSIHHPNLVQANQLRRIPAVNRALELYAVGDLVNARREWNALLGQLEPDEQELAAYLTMQMGWTSQGIRIANKAGLRDHLDLRFPLVYTELFQRISHETTVPHSFLIAIARQESAFNPRAHSSADARGLMQLLGGTAELTARRSGLPVPSNSDLYNPDVNVEIAGHHLAQLMMRYGDQRPLAAAAYNAGGGRVDRWLESASGIATDVWIETIPFSETRNYVKNVLAFAQVYGHLLNQPTPMLHVHEAAVR